MASRATVSGLLYLMNKRVKAPPAMTSILMMMIRAVGNLDFFLAGATDSEVNMMGSVWGAAVEAGSGAGSTMADGLGAAPVLAGDLSSFIVFSFALSAVILSTLYEVSIAANHFVSGGVKVDGGESKDKGADGKEHVQEYILAGDVVLFGMRFSIEVGPALCWCFWGYLRLCGCFFGGFFDGFFRHIKCSVCL